MFLISTLVPLTVVNSNRRPTNPQHFAGLPQAQLQYLEAFLASQSAAKPLTQIVAFIDNAWMNHFGESDLFSIGALGLKAADWEQVTNLPIRTYDQQIRDHT